MNLLSPGRPFALSFLVVAACSAFAGQGDAKKIIGTWDGTEVGAVTSGTSYLGQPIGTRFRSQMLFMTDGTLIRSKHIMPNGTTFDRDVMRWRIAAPGMLIVTANDGEFSADYAFHGDRLFFPSNTIGAPGELEKVGAVRRTPASTPQALSTTLVRFVHNNKDKFNHALVTKNPSWFEKNLASGCQENQSPVLSSSVIATRTQAIAMLGMVFDAMKIKSSRVNAIDATRQGTDIVVKIVWSVTGDLDMQRMSGIGAKKSNNYTPFATTALRSHWRKEGGKVA